MQLDDAELKHQAAIHSLGVALGVDILVEPYLRAGELVAPFDIVHHSRDAYYLVCHPDDAADPRIDALTKWLKEMGVAHSQKPLQMGRRNGVEFADRHTRVLPDDGREKRR